MEYSNRQTSHTKIQEVVEKLIQQVVENETAEKQKTAQHDIKKLKKKTKRQEKGIKSLEKQMKEQIADITETIKRIEKEKNKKIKELEDVIQKKTEYQETIEKQAEIATNALKEYAKNEKMLEQYQKLASIQKEELEKTTDLTFENIFGSLAMNVKMEPKLEPGSSSSKDLKRGRSKETPEKEKKKPKKDQGSKSPSPLVFLAPTKVDANLLIKEFEKFKRTEEYENCRSNGKKITSSTFLNKIYNKYKNPSSESREQFIKHWNNKRHQLAEMMNKDA